MEREQVDAESVMEKIKTKVHTYMYIYTTHRLLHMEIIKCLPVAYYV